MIDESALPGLIFFIIIFGGLLIPFILLKEFIFRPREMRKLAKEFGLKYRLNEGSAILSPNHDRNIIEGNIENHMIRIYDTVGIYDLPGTFYGQGAKRYTSFTLNGKEEKLTGFISGYYPVNKLRKKIKEFEYK